MHKTGSQQDTKGAPSGPLRYLQDGPSVADANRRANSITAPVLEGPAIVTLGTVKQGLSLGLRFFLRSGIEIVK